MVLELSVLGPAFGLPSIDAECIAAIALLRLIFGCDASKWTLSACHTHTQDLPLLLDGTRRISGFNNISRHLKEYQHQSFSSSTQLADELAAVALIQTRAPLLVSAYLYLSSENWNRVTRGAFSLILSPFARFWLPGALRAQAKENIAHLGISVTDIEDVHNDHRLDSVDSSFEATARHRASLILPSKSSVQDMLSKKEGVASFKLHALADSLFGPLQDLLGNREWLCSGNEPQSLDCLAYGYLSIMQEARMPNDWLSTMLRERYPRLAAYTTRLRDALRLETVLSDLSNMNKPAFTSPMKPGRDASHDKLPWRSTEEHSQMSKTSVLQLLAYLVPSLQSPAVARADEANEPSHRSLVAGVYTVAAAASVLGGATYLLQHLWNAKHGQPVQIFGQRTPRGLDHLSQALAGFNVAFEQPRYADPVGISPEASEHPLTETAIEL